MKVLFLGAGASYAAGYPLGAKLIEAVADHMADPKYEVNAKARWEYYKAFVDLSQETARLLLTSSNPEVVLSYIDICIEALGATDRDVRSEERQAITTLRGLPAEVDPSDFVETEGERLEDLYRHLLESPLRAAVRARSGFIVGLYE